MIKKLIEMNVNLDLTNIDNMSPLDYGISSDNKEIHSLIRSLSGKSEKLKDWTSQKY